MSIDRERVVEQIRKILNLAGNNPNENEVQQALSTARKLMDKYDIEQAEVDVKKNADQNAIEVNEIDGVRRKGAVERMDVLIAMACASVCSCKVLLVRVDPATQAMRFIGFRRDIAVAAALSEQLRIVMRTMARHRYGKQWGNPHTSYGVGFASKLLNRAEHELAARRSAPVAEKGAIVLAKDAAIQRYEASHYRLDPKHLDEDGNLKKPKQSTALSNLNSDAYAAGWSDGSTIDLGASKHLPGGA